MIINVKYDVGDNIRYIDRTSHCAYIICPCCEGKKYITGADNLRYICPNCDGTGKIEEGIIETEEIKTGTIKEVIVRYSSGMDCYQKEPWIRYRIPQSVNNIKQEDILEKI